MNDDLNSLFIAQHKKHFIECSVIGLNSSNSRKIDEFTYTLTHHFGKTLFVTKVDLPEIVATPKEIISHKTSQVDPWTLVEDTCLEVEGASIGAEIRWLVEKLPLHLGKRAVWSVFLGYRDENDRAWIFYGQLTGQLVAPRCNGKHGFDPYFLPDGSQQTLGQLKKFEFSARFNALVAMMNNQLYCMMPVIHHWNGKWQQEIYPWEIIHKSIPQEKYSNKL